MLVVLASEERKKLWKFYGINWVFPMFDYVVTPFFFIFTHSIEMIMKLEKFSWKIIIKQRYKISRSDNNGNNGMLRRCLIFFVLPMFYRAYLCRFVARLSSFRMTSFLRTHFASLLPSSTFPELERGEKEKPRKRKRGKIISKKWLTNIRHQVLIV